MNKATIKFMSTFHPRIVWFHVKIWNVTANRIRKGLEFSPVTEEDFDILTGSGPEDLIANCSPPSLPSNNKLIDDLVVDFLPFRLLSRLLLETSLKRIHTLDSREKLIAQGESGEKLEALMTLQDMDMMRQFGTFNTH